MRSLMLSSVCAAFIALAGCGSNAPGGYPEPDSGNPDGPTPDAGVPPICCLTLPPDAEIPDRPDASDSVPDAGGSDEVDGGSAEDGGAPCGIDDDCEDGEVCLCPEDEECGDGRCVPQDPSCPDDPECSEPDPYDNHCNGHGHYSHGNGHGYGHCHHHQH